MDTFEAIKTGDINNLIQNQDAHCISIYLPTHMKGKEVLGDQDRIAFKTALQEIQKNLGKLNYSENEQREFLAPARAFLEDSSFWHNMGKTLVVFLSKNLFLNYKLPYKLGYHVDLSNIFYLAPILPFLHTNSNFFLLTLSKNKNQLFEASPYSMDKIDTRGILPESMEKVVGKDFEQKTLQYRSVNPAQSGFVTHGHGEGKDDQEKELLDYFRAIDHGLRYLIHDKNFPLVIATVDEHFSLYKKINTNPQLINRYLRGNPDHISIGKLHNQALDVIDKTLNVAFKNKVKDYRDFMNTGLTDYLIDRIITNSINGKVDRLFVNKEASVFGWFDRQSNKPIFQDQKQIHNVDLLNLAATYVFLQNGEVFFLQPHEMPEPNKEVNAKYRYP